MSISKLVLSSSLFIVYSYGDDRDLHSFPTRRSSDLARMQPREDLRVPLRPLARSDRRRRHDDDARLRSAGTLHERGQDRRTRGTLVLIAANGHDTPVSDQFQFAHPSSPQLAWDTDSTLILNNIRAGVVFQFARMEAEGRAAVVYAASEKCPVQCNVRLEVRHATSYQVGSRHQTRLRVPR